MVGLREVQAGRDHCGRKQCTEPKAAGAADGSAGREDKNTGMLPEGKILQYADQAVFGSRHTIFYRKHGPRATVACTECGRVTDARWKQGQSYESMYERLAAEPVENHYGICPACGNTGIFIPQGRAARMRAQKGCLFLGQKYKETGFVLRYVEVEKEWRLEEDAGKNGQEMAWAYEELSGLEIARIYFEPGKRCREITINMTRTLEGISGTTAT